MIGKIKMALAGLVAACAITGFANVASAAPLNFTGQTFAPPIVHFDTSNKFGTLSDDGLYTVVVVNDRGDQKHGADDHLLGGKGNKLAIGLGDGYFVKALASADKGLGIDKLTPQAGKQASHHETSLGLYTHDNVHVRKNGRVAGTTVIGSSDHSHPMRC